NTPRLIEINSDSNVIGGATAADRNIIAGGTFGVLVSSASLNQIAGNYFGTDASGSATLGTLFEAVSINSASDNTTIGGATAAEGNVFLGMQGEAIEIAGGGGEDITIQNNLIGVGADGLTISGTGQDSIIAFGSISGLQILDNTIADAGRYAIQLTGSTLATVIQGNRIGTDDTGTGNWGSASAGILLMSGVTDVTIGGTGAGEGNVIANSGQTDPSAAGIEFSGSVSQATIRGNSIYDNAGIGIDFDGNGQNANDVDSGTPTNTDSDTGPNGLQNYAGLVAAGINGSGNFAYQINTNTLTAGQTYTVDFYASPDPGAGSAQGQRYLGSATGISGSTGDIVASIAGVSVTHGETITLLTTDSSGNTSEFSNSVAAYSTPPYNLRVAESTGGGLSINTDGGTNAYLIADDGGALLGGLTSVTAEIQFSTDNFFVDGAPLDASLISYAAAGTSANDILVQVRESGHLAINIGGGVYTSTAMDYRLLADGQPHTLAVTWDSTAGDWTVVVDGQLVDSGTGLVPGHTLGAGGTLIFGQDQDSVVGGGLDPRQAFSGTYQNVRLYNDVRTVDELAASHNRDLDYDTADLIAQWRFDALSGSDVVLDDVSGNNATLTQASGAGFLDGTNELILRVNENAPVGTVIGAISGDDDGRTARINTLLTADPSLVYDAQTNTFYRLSDSTADYSTSLTNAGTTNLNGVAGELAIVRSAHEHNVLAQIAGVDGAYLGGTDSTSEGVWRWQIDGADGDIFWIGDSSGYAPGGAYTNWGSGQPDDFNTGQDVLFLNGSGEWDDIPGVSSQRSIVAWDADEVLDATNEVTYAITSQTVANAFSIDSSTGVVTVDDPGALDFEAPGPFLLTVSATDSQGYDIERTFTVVLDDVNEAGEPIVDLTSGLELNRDGGNDAYLVTTGGGDILGGRTALTFETTVQIDRVDEEAPLISYSSSAGTNSFLAQIRSTGQFVVVFGTETLDFNANNYADMVIGTGAAHTIAVTWDSQTGDVALYIDGELAETQTAATASIGGGPGDGTLIFGQEQDAIGGGFDTSEFLSGTLYDVRLWDNARTAEQIGQNAGRQLQVSGAEADVIGLLANWRMDGFNGSDEVVDDVGGVNLSRGQAVGAGFRPSVIVDDLTISENSANGAVVGLVAPSAAPVLDDVVSDGRFLGAPAPGGIQSYTEGQAFGGWMVSDG
ncbi:MAG: LamG-like jellyroll fold domain-containing protein, partial [Pseudomonadota bacterium]